MPQFRIKIFTHIQLITAYFTIGPLLIWLTAFGLINSGYASELKPHTATLNIPTLGLVAGQDSPKNITAFMAQLIYDQEITLTEALQRRPYFTAVDSPIINENFNRTSRWYTFRVKNTSDVVGTWYFETRFRTPTLLNVFEYTAANTNTLLAYKGNGPYSQRTINHRHLFVEVKLEPNEEKDIYIQLEKMGTRLIPRLITENSRIQQEFYDYCWIIFFLTCLGTLLVANIAQCVATKKSLYLYNASAVFWSAFSILQHDGFNFQFLWPNYPFVDYAFSYYVSIPTALSILQVIRQALNLSEYAPKADRMVVISMIGWLASIPATILFDAASVVEFVLLVFCPFTVVVLYVSSYVSIKHKVPSAYFYLAGWMCYGLGLSSFVLMHVGVNIFTWVSNATHVYAVGILMEGILFYFALAFQVQVLQSQEKTARQTALQLLEEKVSDMETVMKVESEKLKIQEDSAKNSMQFASASHDMHQPLFTIRAILASIKDDLEDKSAMKEIESAFDYLNQIINATLEDSRAQITQTNTHIFLEDLFHDLCARHIHQANDKGLTLKLASTTTRVIGSHLILSRITDNLIRNAIRYTQYGKVLVGIRRRIIGLELQVLDTGIGIAQSDLRRLTLPFERGKAVNVSSQKNYGLGLAITKMLCEQQGYTFSIQSEVGRGSVFSVLIPVTCESTV